jgi:RNA-binding protein NOB1
LKDKNAREHFERLGLSAGVKIEVRSPNAASLSHVIQFAKRTGDYSVLSHADLSVLALTYDLHIQAKAELEQQVDVTPSTSENAEPSPSGTNPTSEAKEDIQQISDDLQIASLEDQRQESKVPEDEETTNADNTELITESYLDDSGVADELDGQEREPLDVELGLSESEDATPPTHVSEVPLYDDPSDEDDGDGEWITPSNVALHKSRALDLLPSADASRKGKGRKDEVVAAGCMTADFAMQNVLLQMGLSLVGVEGKRIQKLKTWVLRCHACFKVCKDNSKKNFVRHVATPP